MSSTEYLDQLVLDPRGLVIKESMDGIKGYCGLFAFILSIISLDKPNEYKKQLINRTISASIKFMHKKYEANLDIYNKHIAENLEAGRLFETLSALPAKMREDFELGLQDAEKFLRDEISDILIILCSDITI